MRSTDNWTDAIVDSITDLTPTVREFRIEPLAQRALPAPPGSHLPVQVLVDGQPQLRHYSLVGEPDGTANHTYRIAVKRLDDGRGGSRAMWQLAVGDRLRIGEPQNHFALDRTAPAYLLVAGGIGVTPLVGMAQAVGRLASEGRGVRMLYGARSADELAYVSHLRQALGDALTTAVSSAGDRIDFDAEISALPAGGHMIVCGPVPMLEAARHAWLAAGRPIGDLRYETFGSSGRLAAQPFRVQLPRHHLDIVVPTGQSLLDALEQAGVATLFDCRRGECGLCAMDIVSVNGEVDHRDVFLSEDEKEKNTRICACVSRVVGEITLDSAYRPDS
jgi:ferredoxin-NADP reductase